ncbi:acetyl-CoA carboxylase, biotin carboxyl carrier protein [Candidatus Poribacteria bacterium]|jgi:acetyl-CoA carboxylase biotin carboxyl carrier protein|nr:acetyl-CoA carboxylase, biotin carboxyl carrier protein [Candidatus Poribacteria bacterium]|tara:strand:+ start:280 stop:732 length:453 start_codon:yes stop_codon:yes gene_type:complete
MAEKKSGLTLIEQICDIMDKRDLAEVELTEGQVSVRVRRANADVSPVVTMATTPPEQQVVGVVDTSESILRGELIRSPMPGMFYRASSPDEPPFVQVGDSVSKNDTICLIEAMKIFNEVQSESDCDIIEILVENATAIEFDQPLFRIKRS